MAACNANIILSNIIRMVSKYSHRSVLVEYFSRNTCGCVLQRRTRCSAAILRVSHSCGVLPDLSESPVPLYLLPNKLTLIVIQLYASLDLFVEACLCIWRRVLQEV